MEIGPDRPSFVVCLFLWLSPPSQQPPTEGLYPEVKKQDRAQAGILCDIIV